ncbi:hypothetical protein U1Q18_044282, partial [Sarracenia purpurea var. burkii]
MVPKISTVSGLRVLERYRYDKTLLVVVARNDDSENAFRSLMKQSTTNISENDQKTDRNERPKIVNRSFSLLVLISMGRAEFV